MSFEKLAIFGILVFGFMALVQGLRTVREVQKMRRRAGSRRPRRVVSSEPVAEQIAVGLVTEVAKKYPELCVDAKKSGVLPKPLEHALAKAREHYAERVNPKFKGLFYRAINSVILKK
ncbi:MAG: hypothetical protein JXX29_01415 [Deltaproteobacteria bacterium]|nr:hypothetical protein [Deltaproteobacteria bacterium]MBN2670298.1 hypothetical protein [Deltaproteobacteria bacterium]